MNQHGKTFRHYLRLEERVSAGRAVTKDKYRKPGLKWQDQAKINLPKQF